MDCATQSLRFRNRHDPVRQHSTALAAHGQDRDRDRFVGGQPQGKRPWRVMVVPQNPECANVRRRLSRRRCRKPITAPRNFARKRSRAVGLKITSHDRTMGKALRPRPLRRNCHSRRRNYRPLLPGSSLVDRPYVSPKATGNRKGGCRRGRPCRHPRRPKPLATMRLPSFTALPKSGFTVAVCSACIRTTRQ